MEGHRQPPRYPPQDPQAHFQNSYLDYDLATTEEQQHHHHHHHHQQHQHLQDPNVWQYGYIPTSAVHIPSNLAWAQSPQNLLYPPALPSNTDAIQAGQPIYSQRSYSPVPTAYHTPTAESHYLTPAAVAHYGYHASPHLSAYPSPVSRSMSVSAVSNASIDQATNQSSRPAQPQQSNTFLPTPRQIRFVSTDGQPHAKRRRINAACLTCRKRKTRCSGERPQCKTCSDNGHKCAGYADKAQRKEDDRHHGDGDDDEDDESRSSSPRRQDMPIQKDLTRSAQARPAQHEHRYVGGSSSTPNSRTRPTVDEQAMDSRSPMSNHTTGSAGAATGRTGVPYFRYFGPTAIVPGFKQMVVQMKDGREQRRSYPSLSVESPAAATNSEGTPLPPPEPVSALADLPYYDATTPTPTAPLITGLCETFFTALGCNYPFLQRTRFLKDLEEKRVDAILVNAVCAVSARFSADPILKRPSDDSLPLNDKGNVKRAFRGQPFAARAMSAVIDTFPYPTLAVTQACLLLAYEEFGSDRDSGLWMYLGTSIRMAQDLGIQKLEGLQLEGRIGPTPKTAKGGDEGRREETRRAEQQKQLSHLAFQQDDTLWEDRRASEQERIDTFWSIFFLDRAVSSGVGRPVTLRDKDIEISFPYRTEEHLENRYPDPFPAMIRIVHMYGRVADVLNNIRDILGVTPDVLKRLAGMEKDLTGIYQKLSPKLHFNAINFQHYVKAEQGTNFILLHFWFHTLIVLLHQPTLLHSFEGQIQQLFTDSKELSMSSAKTIADILAFAELIDVKSFIGNPFTSQPMYVAACAFLAEAAAHASQPPSRGDSPYEKYSRGGGTTPQTVREPGQKLATKHSLLASAANQNYQRCYKALKTLDSYWAGCRYILTALDQKAKGLMDPLLFTSEDVDEMPSTEPSFTTPGWRRSSFGVSLGGPTLDRMRLIKSSSSDVLWSPKRDFGNAIGWSITGTGKSPAPNLSFLYQNPSGEETQTSSALPSRQQDTVPRQFMARRDQNRTAQSYSPSASMLPPRVKVSSLPYDPVSTAEADLLLGLHSPYSVSSNTPPTSYQTQSQGYMHVDTMQNPYYQSQVSSYSDLFIESQDIDMSNQHNFQFNSLNFPGGDIIPLFEYLPSDVLDYFGDPNDIDMNSGVDRYASQGGTVLPSGPGPPQNHIDRGHEGRDNPDRQQYRLNRQDNEK